MSTTPERPLTARQREFLCLIYRHVSEHGTWPSFEDLKTPLGVVSNNGITRHLDVLRQKGYMEARSGRPTARSIRLQGARLTLALEETEAGARLRQVLEDQVSRDLTRRQVDVLQAVYDHMTRHQAAPTVRELLAMFDQRSPNGMRQHLAALMRKGWLTWEPMTARSIRLAGARMALTFDEGEAGERLRQALAGADIPEAA